MRLHFHRWEFYAARGIPVYDVMANGDLSPLPKRHDTELSGTCRVCKLPKVKRIGGAWTPRRDEGLL